MLFIHFSIRDLALLTFQFLDVLLLSLFIGREGKNDTLLCLHHSIPSSRPILHSKANSGGLWFEDRERNYTPSVLFLLPTLYCATRFMFLNYSFSFMCNAKIHTAFPICCGIGSYSHLCIHIRLTCSKDTLMEKEFLFH